MYDFHVHSVLSDGELLPAELAQRYKAKGYKAIAISDHVDVSNIKIVVPSIVEFCRQFSDPKITVIPAIELTHILLNQFDSLIKYARSHGIKLIIAHGETLVEPVIPGTNKKALQSNIDILAHPGLISEIDAKLAAKRGIYLELTGRKGHCISNGHVAKIATQAKAKMVFNSDCHSAENILDFEVQRNFIKASGLIEREVDNVLLNMNELFKRCAF